jgi:hypothetical protein
VIKLRFSDLFSELLEFEVETTESRKNRITTVIWKMLDGFTTNNTFFTDLNGLEMSEKKYKNQSVWAMNSAVAIRDTQSFR